MRSYTASSSDAYPTMSEYASARRSAISGPRRRHTEPLQYASSDQRVSSRAALQSTTPLIRPPCQRTLLGLKSPCVKTCSDLSEGKCAVTALTALEVKESCWPAGGRHVSASGGRVSAPSAPSRAVS